MNNDTVIRVHPDDAYLVLTGPSDASVAGLQVNGNLMLLSVWWRDVLLGRPGNPLDPRMVVFQRPVFLGAEQVHVAIAPRNLTNPDDATVGWIRVGRPRGIVL